MENDTNADTVRAAAARRPVPPAAGDGRALQQQGTETTDDIIRGMRALGALDAQCGDMIPRSLLALGLRTYADRIEAAAARERNAHINDVHDTLYAATGLPGNAAMMRAALVAVLDHAPYATEHATMLTAGTDLIARIRAALFAPARNCDRFATVGAAHKAWRATDQERDFADWLFDPAEGKEAANDPAS